MQYFDKVVYTFSADNEPTGTIDSGEIVIFRTQDCFSNQMHSESQLVTSCDYSKMNPATGPLFVRDAQPGDVILMHDDGGDRSQTVEALRLALPTLKEKGYEFVTIDELMAMDQGKSTSTSSDSTSA